MLLLLLLLLVVFVVVTGLAFPVIGCHSEVCEIVSLDVDALSLLYEACLYFENMIQLCVC